MKPWLAQLWRCLGLPRREATPGSQGEQLACGHLQKQGCHLLARNVRTRRGEIDILALSPDRQTVLVVEVKTSQHQPTSTRRPEHRVDARKQQRLLAASVQVLKQYHQVDKPVRFDVIAVELVEHGKPIIRHSPGAFESRY